MSKIIGQKEISLSKIVIDEQNVRRSVGALGGLEDSIEKYGVIEPIIVRPDGDKYKVVAGSLRYTASKNVGLKTIPAIIKEMTDEEAFIESAIENIQRHTLEPDEEADLYARAYRIFGTQNAVAKAFTQSESTVNKQLEAARMIGLIKDVKKKPQHAEVTIPRDTTKVENISRAAKHVFKEEPEKQVEMFEALKDKPRAEVKRALTYVKAKAEMEPEVFKEKPVKEVVEDAFKVINVDVSVQFTSKTSKALIKAAEVRGLSWEDIVEIATERWLEEQGFL
jgi:ParB family chromosome partitioning protein